MPSEHQQADVWVSRSHPVQEDMGFQRVWWRTERAAWLIMAAVVVLALLGVFSSGLFGKSIATSQSGQLRVEYGRVERNGGITELRVDVGARQVDQVRLRLGADMSGAFKFEDIMPKPQETQAGANGVEMVFSAAVGEPFTIHFSLRPQSVGLVIAELSLASESPVRFTQLILP